MLAEYEIQVNEFTITIMVDLGRYSPTKIWQARDEWKKYIAASEEFWDMMDDERKEGVQISVKNALQRLHDKVEEWLPEALDGSNGSFVDVQIRIMLTDADQEISKHAMMSKMRFDQAERQSIELLRKLNSHKS